MADEVKVSWFTRSQRNLVRFFREIKSELKKVIWPDRKQLVNNTISVLATCFVVGFVIWVADLVFGKLSTILFG